MNSTLMPVPEQEIDMDPLLIGLIIVAVIALSGWGYGTYAVRPASGEPPKSLRRQVG